MAFTLFAAACGEQAAPPALDTVAWRTIGTWSGRGNRQTGSFSVETGALRVRWEARTDQPPSTGTFRVSLHSAISGRRLQVAVDHRGAGADTTYLEDNARVSYLVIDSQNLDWTLSLDEAVRPTAR
jgi:hypothetical protein